MKNEEREMKELNTELKHEYKELKEGIFRRMGIHNTLITDIESDIRIVEHKIECMKDEYRQYDDECDFTDRLMALYGELGGLTSKRDAMKQFPFYKPNPTWVFSETNSDPNFTVGYEDDGTMSLSTEYNPFAEALVSGVLGDDEGAMKMTPIDYDSQLDRLNKDL